MRAIKRSNNFKKNFKTMLKRGKDERKLFDIIKILATDLPVPEKYKDHQLKGILAKFRELHIEPDWLLVYFKQPSSEEYTVGVLFLEATGSHADLF